MNWSPPYIYMGLYEEESDTLDTINPAQEGDFLIYRVPQGEKVVMENNVVQFLGPAGYVYRVASDESVTIRHDAEAE